MTTTATSTEMGTAYGEIMAYVILGTLGFLLLLLIILILINIRLKKKYKQIEEQFINKKLSSVTNPIINTTITQEQQEPEPHLKPPFSTFNRNQVDFDCRESIELHAVSGFVESTGEVRDIRSTELSNPRPYKRKSDYKVTISESGNDVYQSNHPTNSLEESGDGFPNATSNSGRLMFDSPNFDSPKVALEGNGETQIETTQNPYTTTTEANNVASEKIDNENRTPSSDFQSSELEPSVQVAEF